jgi:hypothetical protein
MKMTTKHINELAAHLGDGSKFSSLSDIRKWAEENELRYKWWCYGGIYEPEDDCHRGERYIIVSPLDWDSSFRACIHWGGDFIEKDLTIQRDSMSLTETLMDLRTAAYPTLSNIKKWAEVNKLEYFWKPSGHPAGTDNYVAAFPRSWNPSFQVFVKKNGEEAEITAI